MLGKLLKHEFKSYGFSMGIIFLAGSCMALFMKILSLIPYSDNTKNGIQMLMVFGFVLTMSLASIAVTVMIIVRFYSTTVSDQAYLTWTLPAKTSTILWSKLLAGLFWKIICVLVIAVFGIIFFTGSYWMWHEELSGFFMNGEITPGMMINELLKELSGQIGSKQIISFVIYYIGAFISSISGILLIYMCIGIGQLFGKYRVVASIGFYFLIVIVLQIVSTIGVVVLSGITVKMGDSSEVMMGKYGFTQSIGTVVFGLVSCTVLFLITNYLFDKHLNLD